MDNQPASYRWWAVRPAQNLKPTSYICPLCDQQLHAMSEHTLLVPEGDASCRRHAHTACVVAARKAGKLPTVEEWRKTQPPAPGRASGGADTADRLVTSPAARRRLHVRPRPPLGLGEPGEARSGRVNREVDVRRICCKGRRTFERLRRYEELGGMTEVVMW